MVSKSNIYNQTSELYNTSFVDVESVESIDKKFDNPLLCAAIIGAKNLYDPLWNIKRAIERLLGILLYKLEKSEKWMIQEIINEIVAETGKDPFVIPNLEDGLQSKDFLADLVKTKSCFVALDNPQLSKLVSYAFLEVSRCTLANIHANSIQKGRETLKQNAQDHALHVKTILDEFKSEGIVKVRDIVEELNRRQIPTYSGKGQWHLGTLARLQKRLRNQDIVTT